MFLLENFYQSSLVDICLNISSLKLEENIVILGQHHTSPINLIIETTMIKPVGCISQPGD